MWKKRLREAWMRGHAQKWADSVAKTLRRKPSKTLGWLKRNWLNQKKRRNPSISFSGILYFFPKLIFGSRKNEFGRKFHTLYDCFFDCCELNAGVAIFWYCLLSLRVPRTIVLQLSASADRLSIGQWTNKIQWLFVFVSLHLFRFSSLFFAFFFRFSVPFFFPISFFGFTHIFRRIPKKTSRPKKGPPCLPTIWQRKLPFSQLYNNWWQKKGGCVFADTLTKKIVYFGPGWKRSFWF